MKIFIRINLILFSFFIILSGCGPRVANSVYIPQAFSVPPIQDPGTYLVKTFDRSQVKIFSGGTATLKRKEAKNGETSRLSVEKEGVLTVTFNDLTFSTIDVKESWSVIFTPNQILVIKP